MAKGIKGSRSGREKPCDQCGKPFWCLPCHDVGGNLHRRRFCGAVCMHAAKKFTPEKAAAAFWKRVDKSASGGCWVWTGYCQRFGHGWMGRHGLSHRYAWKLLRGDLRDDDCLLHKCDNPPCVNPDHLYIGDRALNARDSIARGRHTYGERSHHATLTEAQVREIRRDYKRTARNRSNVKALARRFGVKPGAVYAAAMGMTWKHLPGGYTGPHSRLLGDAKP